MKVKFGAIVTDGRGKIGGHVMSKNRGGAYMRTKVTPSNPRTATQQANRALLGSLSASWSSLTDAFRASWNGAVNDWVSTNIFGDTIKPTGKNLYVALNKNINAIGGATIDTAPEKVEMPILGLAAVGIDITEGEITIQYAGDVDAVQVVVASTGPLSAGTSFTKGKFRKIYNELGADLSPELLYDAYVNRFGVPTAGQNISFEVKLVEANGQISVPETAKATVVAS
jgi:hypothetical protein